MPLSQVIPVDTDLPWEVLGGLPEMVQTAYGSLTIGLDLKPGQSALIRGGTSSVGLAAAALATWRGATVLSTTRRACRLALLKEHGVEHPLLDTGEVAPAVRELYPTAFTPPLISSARRPCPTLCARCACTARPASAAACPTSGRCGTSPRTSTCPKVCAWRATSATPPTCPGRPSRTSSTRSRPAGLPRGPRLRRPGAGAAGPRRHGARPRHRQARRPRPALIRQLRLADHDTRKWEARRARPGQIQPSTACTERMRRTKHEGSPETRKRDSGRTHLSLVVR